MCCIVKHLLYLALVLNYFSHLLLQMCCVAKHLLHWGLCWTTTLIDNVDVLHCKTPLIFGACLELHLSFGTADVLCCKTPLTFGACVEIRLWLTMWMCCIVKFLLYLALVLNYISHLALLMCCAAKHLLYLALVLNYDINWQSGCAALQNTSYIWRLCWLRFSFSIFGVLLCKTPPIFGACVELRFELTMWMCWIA